MVARYGRPAHLWTSAPGAGLRFVGYGKLGEDGGWATDSDLDLIFLRDFVDGRHDQRHERT